jgi:hypothetical protein
MRWFKTTTHVDKLPFQETVHFQGGSSMVISRSSIFTRLFSVLSVVAMASLLTLVLAGCKASVDGAANDDVVTDGGGAGDNGASDDGAADEGTPDEGTPDDDADVPGDETPDPAPQPEPDPVPVPQPQPDPAPGDGDDDQPAPIDTVNADLRQHVIDMRNAMPGIGSEGFVRPDADDLATWRTAMQQLVGHEWAAAAATLASRFPSYRLIRFVDTGDGDAEYYVVEETTPVVKGWGAVLLNPAPQRELAIEVPHPVFDTHTHTQGVDLFRDTGARFLLIAGTHRCANAAPSGCAGVSNVCGDGVYHESDVGHFTGAPFHVAHEVITLAHPALHALSIHGNDDLAECGDWFLSAGSNSVVPPILEQIQQNFPLGSPLVVYLPDDPHSCPHYGTTNVQGRFTNGSPAPCTQSAPTANGRFLHAEQSWAARTNPDYVDDIVESLNASF